jgi:anti-repressor protein
MLVVNEAGVYKLVFTSRKPEAERFTDWIAEEVIPAIRKHGMYATPQTVEAMIQDPDTMIRVLQELKAERERRQALERKVEEDRPKVVFADAVEASHTSILVGDLAKLLRQNGVQIGQNRLFQWLRDNGYLIKSGSSRNMPTQYSMERGWFEVKERAINNPDGSIRVTKTTKVTGKGQQYFINLFLDGEGGHGNGCQCLRARETAGSWYIGGRACQTDCKRADQGGDGK